MFFFFFRIVFDCRRLIEISAPDVIIQEDMEISILERGTNNNNIPQEGPIGGIQGTRNRGGGIGLACGGCGSPRPEQTRSHRGQKRTLHSSPLASGMNDHVITLSK